MSNVFGAIITIVGLALIIFWVYIISERPMWAFHKWRIIKNVHKNGKCDYTLQRNGFCGLPFLYCRDNMFWDKTENFTLERAKELFSRRTQIYMDTIGEKIQKREVVEL